MQKNKWNIKGGTVVKRIPIAYDKAVDQFIFDEEAKKQSEGRVVLDTFAESFSTAKACGKDLKN